MGDSLLLVVKMDPLKVIYKLLIKVWTLLSDPINTKRKTARKRSSTADDHWSSVVKLQSPGRRTTKFDFGEIIFDNNPFQQFSGHTSAITDLSWSFSHYFLLSASLDQTARLWNISNSQCLCVNYNHNFRFSIMQM
jgi:WD40 repeat protein